MLPPRVFISSVMDGFSAVRATAKEAVASAGGVPVAAEDFPALPSSPRTACLDAVTGCDIFILIVGARGGSVAPSGKLVVREEYDEAMRLGLPILVFIQDTERDPDAQRLVDQLSEYVNGRFRRTFEEVDSLDAQLKDALRPLAGSFMVKRRELSFIGSAIDESTPLDDNATLRLACAPARDGEAFEVTEIGALCDSLLSIGHAPSVRLLDYRLAKEDKLLPTAVEIIQKQERRACCALDLVRIRLHSSGLLLVDVNVTGSDSFHGPLAILTEDLERGAVRLLGFARDVFARLDLYRRLDPMLMNAALCGVGMRQLLDSLPASGSFTLGLGGSSLVPAFDESRVVSRELLGDVGGLTQGIVEMLKRRLRT